jgi:hypothetical protein
VEIPALNGEIETTFKVERNGNTIHIQPHGPEKVWNVALSGSTFTQMEKQIKEASLQLN